MGEHVSGQQADAKQECAGPITTLVQVDHYWLGRRPRGHGSACRTICDPNMKDAGTGAHLLTQASGGAGALVHAGELAHDSLSVLCYSGTAGIMGVRVHGQAYAKLI